MGLVRPPAVALAAVGVVDDGAVHRGTDAYIDPAGVGEAAAALLVLPLQQHSPPPVRLAALAPVQGRRPDRALRQHQRRAGDLEEGLVGQQHPHVLRLARAPVHGQHLQAGGLRAVEPPLELRHAEVEDGRPGLDGHLVVLLLMLRRRLAAEIHFPDHLPARVQELDASEPRLGGYFEEGLVVLVERAADHDIALLLRPRQRPVAGQSKVLVRRYDAQSVHELPLGFVVLASFLGDEHPTPVLDAPL